MNRLQKKAVVLHSLFLQFITTIARKACNISFTAYEPKQGSKKIGQINIKNKTEDYRKIADGTVNNK